MFIVISPSNLFTGHFVESALQINLEFFFPFLCSVEFHFSSYFLFVCLFNNRCRWITSERNELISCIIKRMGFCHKINKSRKIPVSYNRQIFN